MTPSSDLDSTLMSLNLGFAEGTYDLTRWLVRTTRSAPTAYMAERSIQEGLYKIGYKNPLTGAAKLIDGPLAHLVGLDVPEDNS